ncbi:MAG: type II secretion system F family protein [Eubacteriales bacterium]|nr:type II secretion system F family protein [Eubacteriales bacterium]
MSTKLTNQELFNFCQHFAVILHAGISAAEGLHFLEETSSSPRSQEIFHTLIRDMEESGSLAFAMEGSGLFPESMTAYVKIGEEAGCLDEVMDSLSNYYEQEIQIASQIRSAVTYPLIMLGMMAAVILILLVKVLPVFRQVFRQMGMEMEGISGRLLRAGNVISRYSTIFFLLLLLLVAGILFFTIHPKGRARMSQLLQKLPHIREIPMSVDYSRLTQSLSMGLRSGLGPELTLELAQNLITHPLVLERLKKTEALLQEGERFGTALTESGLFSGMNGRLIAVGFQAGSGDEVLLKLSHRFREDSLSMIAQTVSVVEPTIVIALSFLVGLVLLSVMMPLLGILSEMIV